jgi:DNA-binding NtrC family response regulator
MVVEDSRVKLEFARRKAGILVVDDELPITNLLKRSLSQAGYKVSIRSSSTRALQLFRTDPEAFDLVITDQTMPEMTGIEMARHMLKIRPDIPIILCSGYSEVVDEKTARNAGLSKFLLKPIIPNELSALIARLLEKKNETQARRE